MSRRGENIYKRKDGRWEGRYPKGRKENGRLRYGYVYGKTYREVKKLVIMYRSQYQEIQEIKGEYAGTVTEWVSMWMREVVQVKVKPSTYASYHHKFQTYILPVIGELSLNQLTTQHLQKLVQAWQKQELSASTIHLLMQLLRKSCEYACRQRYIYLNPCEGVVLPKRQAKAIRSLSVTEQKQLEAVAKKDKHGAATLLALHTGLRIGELAALAWGDIDFDEQVIRVQHTYQRIPVVRGSQKTKLIYGEAKTAASRRTVPFSKEVKIWLQQWQEKSDGPFVFGKGEKPTEPRTLSNHFQRLVKVARLVNLHFHQLRHTFATRCMEAKSNVSAISTLLGHASAKMTLDIYTDGLIEQRRQVIEAMEQELTG